MFPYFFSKVAFQVMEKENLEAEWKRISGNADSFVENCRVIRLVALLAFQVLSNRWRQELFSMRFKGGRWCQAKLRKKQLFF